MSCESVAAFKGVKHFGELQFTNQLEANLKVYLDWAILKIGGWTQVDIPTSGAFGGNFSRLRSSSDPSYTAGTVWEGVRKDWVWETGVDYENNNTVYNPNQVTGITIGGVPYGTGDFYVDYPLGRIVLNNAISTNSEVHAQYCYRNVQVYVADQAPWWDELQKGSLRVDDTQFLQKSSGAWNIGPHHRVQLPAIVVESVSKAHSKGYELGNGDLDRYQDVLVHVITEDRFTRNNIIDWIMDEQEHTIHLIDFNRVYSEGANPLDYRGMVVDNPKVYPILVKESGDGGYRWTRIQQGKCSFERVTSSQMDTINPQLFIGSTRCTMNAVIADV